MTNQKYIALIDCDSFFVSCERKLNPELKGLPVSVVSGERGCVISRSREAKALGLPDLANYTKRIITNWHMICSKKFLMKLIFRYQLE